MSITFGSALAAATEIGSAFTSNTLTQVLEARKASGRGPMANGLVGNAIDFFAARPAGRHYSNYRLAEVREIGLARLAREEKKFHEETRQVCGMGFGSGRLELRQFEIQLLPFVWIGEKRRAIKIRVWLCALPHYDSPGYSQNEQSWFVGALICKQKDDDYGKLGPIYMDPNVDVPV